MNLKKAILPAAIAFLVYVIFSGSLSIYDLVTGVIIAFVAGLLFSDLLISDISKSLNALRLGYLLIYFVYFFFVAEVKAHLNVAKIILDPKLPINPGIVRVPYGVSTDYSIVGVANSITNTPGTVVVDLNKEKKLFYVHWIDVKDADPKKCREEISGTFENFLGKVFD